MTLAQPEQARQEWVTALETRAAWQAAYYRKPAERQHHAAGALVDLDEREPVAA